MSFWEFFKFFLSLKFPIIIIMIYLCVKLVFLFKNCYATLILRLIEFFSTLRSSLPFYFKYCLIYFFFSVLCNYHNELSRVNFNISKLLLHIFHSFLLSAIFWMISKIYLLIPFSALSSPLCKYPWKLLQTAYFPFLTFFICLFLNFLFFFHNIYFLAECWGGFLLYYSIIFKMWVL